MQYQKRYCSSKNEGEGGGLALGPFPTKPLPSYTLCTQTTKTPVQQIFTPQENLISMIFVWECSQESNHSA